MMIRSLVLMTLFFTQIAVAAPELKGSPQELRGFLYPRDHIVSISAQAEEKAYSDQAIISLVIKTEAKKLAQSISNNSKLRQQFTQDLIQAGLESEAIKSSKFSSSPQYGWFGNKPSSYEVINRMAITIKQSEHLETIASIVDQYDQVELSDTTFEHSQKDALQDAVKEKALKKILKRKQFYEQSLGLKLTPVDIRESNFRHQATEGAMALDEAVSASSARLKRSVQAMPAPVPQMGRSPGKQSFDEIKYEAHLTVEFKIED